MPHPSRISSITGAAIAANLAAPWPTHKRVLALTSERAGFYIGLVKWRNQMLALFCLIVFFAFGVFYFRYWVIQKPFGIILFIGEGLDARTLAAARIHAGGAEKPLVIDSLAYTALLKNFSANSAIPDAAAAATALATGRKVPNGTIGMDAAGARLANLFELARDSGRVVGLITDGHLTSPTAASFYGHATTPDNWQDLARQLVKQGEIDVVLGGGAADFLPAAKGGRRTDDRDLVTAIREAGYDFVETLEELEEIPRWRGPKLFGLFADGNLAFANERGALDDQPTLSAMVRRGIELLQFHRGGYLLVVDASLLRKAADEGRPERVLAETVELDHAVSVALSYAGIRSAVIVCSDVAGRAQLESPIQPAKQEVSPVPDQDSTASPAPFAPSSQQQPDSGPSAVTADGSVPPPTPAGAVPEDVLAFGTGLGADALQGTMESTAIFQIIRENL